MSKSYTMNQIWKYEIPIHQNGAFTLEMPHGAKCLTVQVQRGVPCLWALVDDTEEKVKREFSVVGTGIQFWIQTMTYVGTWQSTGFVWHLIDKGEVRSS